ncbi:hypothetical protein HOLleu_41299 [Holothuria leucospilota]|uniref:Uncharacterized protein n=1 Tax=Holothuria leucospilota TaxID=206669 RepID=A0A9Q1BC06_HOLLE|nr:hypothetical protein HOLleu_41299 [Holothuria leucospilota]
MFWGKEMTFKERRVALDGEGHKKKPAVEAVGIAWDPPPVQRRPTLKYLTDIGSPIGNHPTTPQKPEEEEETGSGDESPEQGEESAADAKEPHMRQAKKISYEMELRPGWCSVRQCGQSSIQTYGL